MFAGKVTLRAVAAAQLGAVFRRGLATDVRGAQGARSVFGDLSRAQEPLPDAGVSTPASASGSAPAGAGEDIKPEDVTVENDAALQAYLNPKPVLAAEKLLSPLKRELYKLNVAQNGFFKNGAPLQLAGAKYELKLSHPEIEALEPSVLLRSWRIKSSVKKTNIVLRALKGLPLKKAITQCHFMEKKVAGEIAEMLERGVRDAAAMNYDADKLYVDQLWVHTDGQWVRRVEWKGRGRMGILTHRYVSVRVLLKSEQTKKRVCYEAAQRRAGRKVLNKVDNGKVKGKLPGFYRW